MVSPLFVANWKMNMLKAEAEAFCKEFRSLLKEFNSREPDVGIAPPLSCFSVVQRAFAEVPGVLVGAQNCHWMPSGAHTGEVSAEMLVDLRADFAIVGHSERRQFYGETDQTVAQRAAAVLAKGMRAIVCVGETQEQFEAGKTKEVVKQQLEGSLAGLADASFERLVLAYEPVWAIGTGLTATPEIAEEVHDFIRDLLLQNFGPEAGERIPIQYGGSTKADNIAGLMAKKNINGALVGGASLKPDSFAALIHKGREAA